MRVLVLEDEPVIALNLQTALLDFGYRPIAACNIREAFAVLADHHFDAAILDVSLPGGDSYKFAMKLKESEIPFVFTTGWYIENRPEFQGVPVLEKPFDLVTLETTLAAIFEHTRTEPG